MAQLFPMVKAELIRQGKQVRIEFQPSLSVGELDLLIAAIPKEYQSILAIRNSPDFDAYGTKLINP